MATVIMSNPNPGDPNVQQLVMQGAQYDSASNSLIWPDGHPNDTSGAAGAAGAPTGAAPGGGASGYNPQAGYGYDYLDRIGAQEELIQNLVNQSSERIATMQADMQKEIAKGNNASAERIAKMQNDIAKEQNRIQMLNATVNQAAEARMERELQARLAANPNDLVAYEFYKRSLGSPGTLNNGAIPKVKTAGAGGVPGGVSQYEQAPPAYDDAALGSLAKSLFDGKKLAAWNPNISGEGVFGSEIAPGNTIGRSEFGALSDQEKGIMSSFLNAGINIGGRRVAINPDDYFQGMQNSWIEPLSSGAAGATRYV